MPCSSASLPILGLAALLLTSGCVLQPRLRGVIAGPPQGLLQLNGLGEAQVGDQRLYLPRAAELERYGVVIVDVSAVPAEWRPEHLSDGGLAVAALYKASPLAIAGLRKLDRVLTINERPARIGGLSQILERYDHLRLEVKRPSGEVAQVEARAGGSIHNEDERYIAGLFQYRSTTAESELTVAPLGGLFDYTSAYRIREAAFRKGQARHRELEGQLEEQRAALRRAEGRLEKGEEAPQTVELIAARSRLERLEKELERSATTLHERYYEYFRFSTLGGFIVFESERDMESGDEKGRWTFLFLLKIGDDIGEGA